MPSPLRGYLKETRRPIYSAALVLPFFAVYHIGTFFLRTTYVNGADAMINSVLRLFSVDTIFASALALAACFLIWQVCIGGTWTIHTAKLGLLYLESFAFAGLLFLIFGWLATHWILAASAAPAHPGRLASLVLFCGAGIYEELIFRGALLGGLLLLFERALGMKRSAAALWATLLAAAIFSAFHYVGPGGDTFALRSFLQRALAGIYFSALYVGRGFGVAAATHSLYDILIGLVIL